MTSTPNKKRPTKDFVVMNRRRFITVGGMGIAGAAVLAACGGGDDDAATTTAAAGGAATTAGASTGLQANLSSITMGEFNPNYAAQWGYQVADSLGYMSDVGIESTEYVLSDEYIPGLLGGSLDMTHSDTDVAIGSAFASGEPIKMIGMFRTSEWQIMGVNSDIQVPEDLIGQTVTGGPLDGRNTVVQRQILEAMGIDPEEVQFVATSGGSDARLQALLAGTVQGASVFPRHRPALEEAGGQFIYEQLEPAPQEGFAALGGWLEDNGDTAVAWLAAELQGRQFVMDPANKDEAYQIMRDRGFEIPDEFVEQYEVEIQQYSEDGGFEVAAMDTFIDALKETGDVPAEAEWRDYMDFTYLWEAQDSLGIPRSPDPDAF